LSVSRFSFTQERKKEKTKEKKTENLSGVSFSCLFHSRKKGGNNSRKPEKERMNERKNFGRGKKNLSVVSFSCLAVAVCIYGVVQRVVGGPMHARA